MRIDAGAQAARSAREIRKGLGSPAASSKPADVSSERHGDRPGEHMAAAAKASEKASNPSERIGQIVEHQQRLQTAILSRTDTQTLQFEALNITGGRTSNANAAVIQPMDLPTLTEMQASRDELVERAPGASIVHEFAPSEPIRAAGTPAPEQGGAGAQQATNPIRAQAASASYSANQQQSVQNDVRNGVSPSGVHVEKTA